MNIEGMSLGAVASPEPPEPPAAGAPSSVEPAARSEFAELLEGVGHAIDGGETLVGRAERAAYAPMDASTLIALQAGIYRYSEAIDLTAKVVDRTTSAVRTVLQGGH
jgi:hypothetical protein